MKMIHTENDIPSDFTENVIDGWKSEQNNSFITYLTDDGVVLLLNELPKFHPVTGEPLEFPIDN